MTAETRQALAAVLSATVFVSSLAPGTSALAGELRADRTSASENRSSPVGAVALSVPLTGPVLSPVLALSPSLTLGGHAPAIDAVVSPIFVAAAPMMTAQSVPLAVFATSEDNSHARLGSWLSRLAGRQKPKSFGEIPAGESQESAEQAKARAETEFDGLAVGAYVHEDFLGRRFVQGVVRDQALGRLPADANVGRIITQISRQFGISREQVLRLSARFRLDEGSSRQDWLAVYDRLQGANREQFKRLDAQKYHQSFRELANRNYAPGWRGTFRRAAEVHKHFFGVVFGVPYHLLDLFFFGYFRQAIAFEWGHAGEDFLSLSQDKGLARKWLGAAVREQYVHGSGLLGAVRSQIWYRRAEFVFLAPIAHPLATFLVRRLTLAVLSAVAMGLLGAFAPALPLSVGVASVPILGPGVIWALNGLPVLTAAVPWIGPFLAPVVAASAGAIAKDLVLGPVLNTLILSTLLTFPAVVRERLAFERDKHPQSALSIGELAIAVAGAGLSPKFWAANMRTFFGLSFVGAEIAGVMSYAAQLDGLVDPGFQKALGHKPGLFEKIGASVERPKGASPIPFGGAITWGNSILYKLQDLSGLHISDFVMNAVLGTKSFLGAEGPADGSHVSALSIVLAYESGGPSAGVPFDADLWKKSPAEAAQRIKTLAARVGGLGDELAAVKAHRKTLRARLASRQSQLGSLRHQSRSVTAAERGQLSVLQGQLGAKTDENYVRSKLAEATDLRVFKAGGADELKRLKALRDKYRSLLPPPPPDRNGYWDQLLAQQASYKALSARLKNFVEPSAPSARRLPLDPKLREQIETMVSAIEVQRKDIEAQISEREATQSLIRAANQIRNHALRERHNGQDMLRFHTDFSKLATVMDLALSLNEISAAQAAISQMMELLKAKQAAVDASRQQNAASQKVAADGQARVAGWQKEAQDTVDADKASQSGMKDQQTGADLVAARTGSFQQKISGLIAGINAMDKGLSVDAAMQYQKNLDLLPQVAQWRETGNPNDKTAFSLKSFEETSAKIDDFLTQANQSLAKIAGAPDQIAVAIMLEVPGPQVDTGVNPSQQRDLQILADRKAYFQQQLATYQSALDQVNKLMDPDHVTVDEFGLSHGYNQSLKNMVTAHPDNPAAGSKLDAQQDLAQLDAIATELNGLTGSNIPLLSGLSLSDLQTAIKTYGDSLKAVKFPTSTPATGRQLNQAQMDLFLAAQLTPMAARAIINWSIDQATVDAFNAAKAPGGALTVASSGLTKAVGMLHAILADVDEDVAFVNAGIGGGQSSADQQVRQALIDRKTALLKGTIIPTLTETKAMLGTLIDYQKTSIAGVTGASSQYATLFSSEKTLLTQTQGLYNKTLPWALASFGGSEGDVAGSLANIAKWKQSLNQYITGYTDSNGKAQEGITQYQQDMKDRLCVSGCERTEKDVYGQTQPYSLQTKIDQYTAEGAQRAQQINAQDAEINGILAEIQMLSEGKYDLTADQLPTGISFDTPGIAKIQSMADAGTVPKIGAKLQQIANEAKAAGGASLTIGAGGSGTVPVGVQPPITVPNHEKIKLLALAAAERLVPTPNSPISETNAPAAYAMTRLIYADAVVGAAKDGLTKVPQVVEFLGEASRALSDAIAQTDIDVAHVNSNGANESPEELYARKVQMFSELSTLLKQGQDFFGLKTGWDQGAFGTIKRMKSYYDSMNAVYGSGQTVNDNETAGVSTILAALQSTSENLEQTKQKISSWMSQLNPREQSALKRVSDDVGDLQEKTRAVLEANIDWHDFDDKLSRSHSAISADLSQLDEKQGKLSAILKSPDVQDALPADLVRRIEALRLGNDGFALGQAGAPQALAIRKSEFPAFLDTMLGMISNGAQTIAHQDVALVKSDLIAHPQGLAAFIPGSGIMDFGDDADGFYLVYQSKFSVPHGIETGSWVTLGNIASLWGNNASLNGYSLSVPPSEDGSNAPYGDKGVEVQVESLGGRNMVNYLNVDLHRFGFDIPADNSVSQNLNQSRLMIFDDYAMMLIGDKLYVGLAGYGDMALSRPGEHPYYYGGNLKTSVKLTEVMSLDASQQELFAKDPRQFLQNVNIDFTGYDPSLHQDFAVAAKGDDKSFSRTQVGPRFDINRLLHAQGGDTFTVDLFYAKTAGTDDLNQQSVGTTVVKGFSIKNDKGQAWLRIDNRATGELGQKSNSLGDRLSFTMPDRGLTLSGEGQLSADKSSRYAQVSWGNDGGNSSVALGYGSQYIGQNDRLALTMGSSFSLAQLWQVVADRSAENLRGGEVLKSFDADMTDFFGGSSGKSSRAISELKKVYEADIARKLVTQDIGALTRDISDLRRAGAFLDNSRVRAMVGFTSNAVSNDTAERAVGGGFTVGTFTEMTLSKSQKALVKDKAASLYREGLRLQDRLIELTKDWQEAVVAVAEAQWNAKLAAFEAAHAPSEPVRRQAEVRQASAQGALHQALLRYNAMTGRDPMAGSPFEDLNAQDLRELMASIEATIAAPDRYTQILHGLDQVALAKTLGPEPLNIADWLPWVDRLTVGYGAQYQDLLNSQALTAGVSVRLPIYDPSSKDVDKAYTLEASATTEQMAADFRARSLRAQAERENARAWRASAATVTPKVPVEGRRIVDAIRAYRNGLTDADALRAAFESWRWYASTALKAQSQASLASAQEALDAALLPKPAPSSPLAVTTLSDVFDRAVGNSSDLSEVALRSLAAEQMARAEDHRVQKFWVDVNIGVGLNATGTGWLPSIGVTGIPVTPVFGFELRPEELRELQVNQHDNQKAYYDALKTSLEAGLAAQLYQHIVAYRWAQRRLDLYRDEILPKLKSEAVSGGAAARQRLDQALLDRDLTAAQFGSARAALNQLLGRAAEANLDLNIDLGSARTTLSRLLSDRRPVEAQRAILSARVEIARSAESIVDKNLKVNELQLEPVSMVVRALGRLVGALSGTGPADAELAAQARLSTVAEERSLEAYDGQRESRAARLRLELHAALNELAQVKGKADLDLRLRAEDLQALCESLRAGLLTIGEDPDAASGGGKSRLPSTWSELRGRLVDAEQAMMPTVPSGAPKILESGISSDQPPSAAAYARYDYALQTIGRTPIDKGYAEGWVELRLKNPNVPPEVLQRLAKLSEDKAQSLRRVELAGAVARADMAAAEFENDVRLMRWIRSSAAQSSGAGRLTGAASLIKILNGRLDVEGRRIISLLGLPAQTVADLAALVPDQVASAAPSDFATQLISDIRKSQIESVRRTLFEGGLPPGFANPDDFLSQIKANTITERMSYRGFTPVLVAGKFRGTWVAGGFLEAPDPREIERRLENTMSDLMRRQLESDGRLRELALHLNQLMSEVADGAKQLEAQRREIEAAEGDLKARAALSGAGAPQTMAAQRRLIQAWLDFDREMVATRSAFIALSAELEALGQSAAGSLRPFEEPSLGAPLPSRSDPGSELIDYWTRRMTDPAFVDAEDALLSRIGMPAQARERLRSAADIYRKALKNRDAANSLDFTGPQRLDLLMRNDAEGKRELLRAEVSRALASFGALDARAGPARDVLEFFRNDLEKSVRTGAADLSQKRAIAGELRRTFLEATQVSPAILAEFDRLEALAKTLDVKREALMALSLSSQGEDPKDFVLKNLELDEYLSAQSTFAREMVKALESPAFATDPGLARLLDGLYDVRSTLDQAIDEVKSGRGMAAIDALIMIEQSRLRAARSSGQPPAEIDAIAEALQSLRDKREAWAEKSQDAGLEPVYALVRLGAHGERTWHVDAWLTYRDVKSRLQGDKNSSALPGAVIERDGRLFIDDNPGYPGIRYELIGGVDAAQRELDDAASGIGENQAALDLAAHMKDSDFVAVAGQDAQGHPLASSGLSFADVFGGAAGRPSLYSQGRLFFFDSEAGGRALSPLAALSLSPERVVIKLYGGARALARDRFATLQSLEQSDQAANFRTLAVSPKGAAGLRARAMAFEASQRRRGWIEVKLNSFGFARDESGRMVQLYGTREDFEAQSKVLGHAKWTLYRTSDLDLAFDQDGNLVRATAPAARGENPLDEQIVGGGPAERHVRELSAAVLDLGGRLIHAYATQADVDAAAPSWSLMSYAPGADVEARLPDGSVRATARISHYEEKGLPVLLSERYLTQRLGDSQWKQGLARFWPVLPGHWGDLLLEVPREIVQAPIEIFGGRDLNSSHYLGRARTYKTEGGQSEHHGFWRSVLGGVDVLNLLPDTSDPYYDPSQFPDAVRLDSPLKPGEILADKRIRAVRGGKDYDVTFGTVELAREERQAAEDLTASRERTLARFNGGVEQIVIETRRGRAGAYEDSSISVRSGEEVAFAADSTLDSDGDFTVTQVSGALFVDRVLRRVTVYPGAAGYAREARAMDGYGARVDAREARAMAARPALKGAEAAARRILQGHLLEREAAVREESELWSRWRALAARVGGQEEIERGMAALSDRIKDIKRELDWWTDYEARLKAVRSGAASPSTAPQTGSKQPTQKNPERPNPDQPQQHRREVPLWIYLFGVVALAVAFWRRRDIAKAVRSLVQGLRSLSRRAAGRR